MQTKEGITKEVKSLNDVITWLKEENKIDWDYKYSLAKDAGKQSNLSFTSNDNQWNIRQAVESYKQRQ